jgi:hypothetical protein
MRRLKIALHIRHQGSPTLSLVFITTAKRLSDLVHDIESKRQGSTVGRQSACQSVRLNALIEQAIPNRGVRVDEFRSQT